MSIGLKTRMILGLALGLALLAAFASSNSVPRAAAVTTECPAGDVCVWEGGTFGGTHRFFEGSSTGCYGVGFPIHSARNHTGNHTLTFGTTGVAPGAEVDVNGTQGLCID